jgi:acyl-homoserine lactone acylase PvdQ
MCFHLLPRPQLTLQLLMDANYHLVATAAADFKWLGQDGGALSCIGERSEQLGGSPFSVGAGGIYRQVLDFEEPAGGKSLFISAPGQSGNPLSEWYDNMLPTWVDGDYDKMRTASGSGGYRIERTQTLLPS